MQTQEVRETQNVPVKKALDSNPTIMVKDTWFDIARIYEARGKRDLPLEERIQNLKVYFKTGLWADNKRMGYYIGKEVLEDWGETLRPFAYEEKRDAKGHWFDWEKRAREVKAESPKMGRGGKVVEYSLLNLSKVVKVTDPTLKKWIDFAYYIDHIKEVKIEEHLNEHWGMKFGDLMELESRPIKEKPEMERVFDSCLSGLESTNKGLEKILESASRKELELNGRGPAKKELLFYRALRLGRNLDRFRKFDFGFDETLKEAMKNAKKKAEEDEGQESKKTA